MARPVPVRRRRGLDSAGVRAGDSAHGQVPPPATAKRPARTPGTSWPCPAHRPHARDRHRAVPAGQLTGSPRRRAASLAASTNADQPAPRRTVPDTDPGSASCFPTADFYGSITLPLADRRHLRRQPGSPPSGNAWSCSAATGPGRKVLKLGPRSSPRPGSAASSHSDGRSSPNNGSQRTTALAADRP